MDYDRFALRAIKSGLQVIVIWMAAFIAAAIITYVLSPWLSWSVWLFWSTPIGLFFGFRWILFQMIKDEEMEIGFEEFIVAIVLAFSTGWKDIFYALVHSRWRV